MKLLFRQRFFSWFDSYDIYDENDDPYFTVKGKLAWGHLFHIFNRSGKQVGSLKEQIFRWLPHFDLFIGENKVGEIVKKFTFFKPLFEIDCNGWQINGDWLQWNYSITQGARTVATISKEIWNFTDTYILDIDREEDALLVLMVVLAIDAVKCSQNNG